jgi:tetratricopeptide (TPR) repeat protein
MRSVLVAALLLLAAAAHAATEIESELVQKGVAAYENLDFPLAIDTLNRALGESLTRNEKIVAYKTLGFAYSAVGRTDDALGAFTHLLRLDGNAELDRSVAPRVRAIFEEARTQVATGHGGSAEGTALPTLHPEVAPAHPTEGQALMITVVHPGGLARELHLFHRVRGEESYSEIKVPAQGDRFSLTIPGTAVHAPALEYYLTAVNDEKVAMARAGTLAAPLTVDVAPLPKRASHRKALVWGLVGAGAVLVAGGVATALALTLGRPNGSTSDVMLISPR